MPSHECCYISDNKLEINMYMCMFIVVRIFQKVTITRILKYLFSDTQVLGYQDWFIW